MATSRLDHLWAGANALLVRAPTVGNALAARLAASVMKFDGMSSSVRRLHCSACGGLMAPYARVRLQSRHKRLKSSLGHREGERAGKSRAPKCHPTMRNHVLRTCATCSTVNRHEGRSAGKSSSCTSVDILRVAHAKKKRGHVLKSSGIPTRGSAQNRRRKRKRSTSMVASIAGRAAVNPANGTQPVSIASSFLFRPL